jgi:hypothetical protein
MIAQNRCDAVIIQLDLGRKGAQFCGRNGDASVRTDCQSKVKKGSFIRAAIIKGFIVGLPRGWGMLFIPNRELRSG